MAWGEVLRPNTHEQKSCVLAWRHPRRAESVSGDIPAGDMAAVVVCSGQWQAERGCGPQEATAEGRESTIEAMWASHTHQCHAHAQHYTRIGSTIRQESPPTSNKGGGLSMETTATLRQMGGRRSHGSRRNCPTEPSHSEEVEEERDRGRKEQETRRGYMQAASSSADSPSPLPEPRRARGASAGRALLIPTLTMRRP